MPPRTRGDFDNRARSELRVFGGSICDDCRKIGTDVDSPNGLMSPTFRLQLKDSWIALRKSADAGCESCKWFRWKGPQEGSDRYETATVLLVRKDSKDEGVTSLDIMSVTPTGQRVKFKTIEVYTDCGDPASEDHRIIQRSVAPSGAHPACLRFLADQLRECEATHPQCPTEEEPVLPTRVLDISAEQEKSAGSIIPVNALADQGTAVSLRLVETGGQKGRYIALSHCWGPPATKPPTTTTGSLSERLRRIAFSELSKVFQDAVTVARALKFTYIWIDSLCIIQDSADDWATESSRMAAVYQNATLCIAASRARDTTVGFLQGRPWQQDACALPFSSTRTAKAGLIFLRESSRPLKILEEHLNHPLHARGWTYQERLLSSRMVFFDAYELLWECCEGRILESKRPLLENDSIEKLSQFKDLTRYDKPRLNNSSLSSKAQATSRPGFSRTISTVSTDFYWRWHVILYYFRQRNLSFGDDALPAISGIAAEFAAVLNDTYLAGIWKKNFEADLLWCTQPTSFHARDEKLRRPISRSRWAPSWSWASIGSPNDTFVPSAVQDFGKVLEDHKSTLLEAEIRPRKNDAAMGHIEYGCLRLKGWSRPVRAILNRSDSPYKPTNIQTHLDDVYGFEVLPHFDEPLKYIDILHNRGDDGGLVFECLLLGLWRETRYKSPQNVTTQACCLLLEPSDSHEPGQHGIHFRRVGTAMITPPYITNEEHRSIEWKRRANESSLRMNQECPEWERLRYEGFDGTWDDWEEKTFSIY